MSYQFFELVEKLLNYFYKIKPYKCRYGFIVNA